MMNIVAVPFVSQILWMARLYIGQCLTLTNKLSTHYDPEQVTVQNPGVDL